MEVSDLLEDAARDRIEFGEENGIALFRRRDQRGVERVFDVERRRHALRPELRRHALQQRARALRIVVQDSDRPARPSRDRGPDASNRSR